MARGGTTPVWVVGTSSDQTFNLNEVTCILGTSRGSPAVALAPMLTSDFAPWDYQVATGVSDAEADAQVAAMVAAVGYPWVVVGAAADVPSSTGAPGDWAMLAVNLERVAAVRDGTGGLVFSDDQGSCPNDLPTTAGYGSYANGADAIAGLESYAGLAYTFSNG